MPHPARISPPRAAPPRSPRWAFRSLPPNSQIAPDELLRPVATVRLLGHEIAEDQVTEHPRVGKLAQGRVERSRTHGHGLGQRAFVDRDPEFEGNFLVLWLAAEPLHPSVDQVVHFGGAVDEVYRQANGL